jgi:hypothetical protein
MTTFCIAFDQSYLSTVGTEDRYTTRPAHIANVKKLVLFCFLYSLLVYTVDCTIFVQCTVRLVTLV